MSEWADEGRKGPRVEDDLEAPWKNHGSLLAWVEMHLNQAGMVTKKPKIQPKKKEKKKRNRFFCFNFPPRLGCSTRWRQIHLGKQAQAEGSDWTRWGPPSIQSWAGQVWISGSTMNRATQNRTEARRVDQAEMLHVCVCVWIETKMEIRDCH